MTPATDGDALEQFLARGIAAQRAADAALEDATQRTGEDPEAGRIARGEDR